MCGPAGVPLGKAEEEEENDHRPGVLDVPALPGVLYVGPAVTLRNKHEETEAQRGSEAQGCSTGRFQGDE